MSDNKWNQPAAPPPPLFTGKKERDLVKQVKLYQKNSEKYLGGVLSISQNLASISKEDILDANFSFTHAI